MRSKQRFEAALAIVLGMTAAAHAGNTWDGGGANDNWGTAANWDFDTAPSYGTLTFSGTTRTSNVNNSISSMNAISWTGTAAWTMGGSTTLSLFDFGGTQAKLEANGTGGVTINAPITFAANNGSPPNPFGEINAINSNFSFASGTLTVNGSSVNGIKLFGNSGRDVSFSNTVSASGKWFGFTRSNASQSVTIASGASVTMGDFYVMNGGTLRLAGGSLTTSAVRLGGDFGNTGNQNQTQGGTLALTPAAGGISFAGTINSVTGNTSGALLIDSQNTSGTNTLTSGIFLDSDLTLQQAAGGALSLNTGTLDVKSRTLTVIVGGSNANVTVNQALTSSLGAGGVLVKQGSGTLVLASTSNSYTGTNSGTLNAGGTQIAGGTLAIAGDGSLGTAPAGAYNNVQFTGTGTLRFDAASIALGANRNVSVAASQTATFNTNGNNASIAGVINGSGRVEKAGSGTLTLSGNNSYSGGTDLSAGTILANSTNALGTTGNLRFLGGTLQHSANNTVDYSSRIATSTASIRIDTNGQSVTYASGFGSGSNAGLTKLGAGTLTLSGSNDYSGGTVINQGTVVVNSTTSLGNTAGSVGFTGDGTVRLASSFDTARSYSINAATATIDTNGFNQTHSGAFSGDGNLIKAGGGTLTLTSASIGYAGTTAVSAGSLIVNGTLNTQASSTVSVSSGATIGGSGTIDRPVSLVNGSILSPGGGSSDQSLDVRSLSLANTTAVNFHLSPTNTTTDGSVNDVVSVTLSGGLTLDGVLNVTTLGGAFTGVANGTTWRLFNYSGSLTNNTLSLGTMPSLGTGLSWSIDTATAGQVNLSVVPEPLVTAGAGLLGLTMLKRRRASL